MLKNNSSSRVGDMAQLYTHACVRTWVGSLAPPRIQNNQKQGSLPRKKINNKKDQKYYMSKEIKCKCDAKKIMERHQILKT